MQTGSLLAHRIEKHFSRAALRGGFLVFRRGLNRIPDLEHGVEDGVPGLLLFEEFIGEHAAIPADVLDTAVGVVL